MRKFKNGDLVRIKKDTNLGVVNFVNSLLENGFEVKHGMVGKIDGIHYELGAGKFITDDGREVPIFLDDLELVNDKPTVELTIVFDGENLEIGSDIEIKYPTQYEHALASIVSALYDLLGVKFDD